MRSSTTWTMSRVLERVQAAGDRVMVYVDGHAFEGTVQAIGDFLLTLEDGADVIVVELGRVSGVRVCQQSSLLDHPGDAMLDLAVLDA